MRGAGRGYNGGVPRVPLRVRLAFLLPLLPSLLAVALLMLVVMNRPISFVERPFKWTYNGGTMIITHWSLSDAVGPRFAGQRTSATPVEFRVFEDQLEQWKAGLPRIDWSGPGVYYLSQPVVYPRHDGVAVTAARHRMLQFGLSYVLLLTALLFLLTLGLYRRARRQYSQLTAGLCISCGYDLRATPGRCPECGHVPATATATATATERAGTA